LIRLDLRLAPSHPASLAGSSANHITVVVRGLEDEEG
jgi:hypothetical protein